MYLFYSYSRISPSERYWLACHIPIDLGLLTTLLLPKKLLSNFRRKFKSKVVEELKSIMLTCVILETIVKDFSIQNKSAICLCLLVRSPI